MMRECDIHLPVARENRRWNICGRTVPKDEIVFLFQVTLIYMVVITYVVNLILGLKNTHLWIALLSSSLGYILPAPKLGTI